NESGLRTVPNAGLCQLTLTAPSPLEEATLVAGLGPSPCCVSGTVQVASGIVGSAPMKMKTWLVACEMSQLPTLGENRLRAGMNTSKSIIVLQLGPPELKLMGPRFAGV